MRDSNYKSIVNNKAAVTITTSLYDRRALDVTSDKPLVNSLNHLTYLVSSSAKVRETLSNDGGIERLIEILHECHNSTFNLNDNIFNSEKKLLTAWKWTLAFQCLVLIGTRGTEKIRQKVVKAGMLPIIATVLDNYLTLYERTFVQARAGLDISASQLRETTASQDGGVTRLPSHLQPQAASFSFSDAQLDSTPTTTNTSFQDANPVVTTMPPTGAPSAAAMPLQPPQDPLNDAMINDDAYDTTNNATTQFLSQIDLFQTALMAMPQNQGAVDAAHLPGNVPSFFENNHTSSLTSDDYDSLSVEQLFKLVRVNSVAKDHNLPSSDLKRRYLIVNIIKKLREEKEDDLPEDKFVNDCDYDMDNGLQFLLDMFLQDDRNSNLGCQVNMKAAPRNFTETGVVIPRDDDIVWSLQLLAYISKYPHLKEVLQNTHLVIDMSIRDKQLKLFLEKQMKLKLKKKLAIKARPTIIPKSRKRTEGTVHPYVERFKPSPSNSPQMLGDIIQNDDLILEEDKFDLNTRPDEGLIENAEAEDEFSDDSDRKDLDDDDDEYLLAGTKEGPTSYLTKLYDLMINAESIVNDLDREVALFQISDRINGQIELECKRLTQTIIDKRLEKKKYLAEKWNYDTYTNYDIDGECSHEDYDELLVEYKKVNLFPMVEKFTFLAGTDMYYWSGVIMRNSCRRNDFRGGVRQCGNLECGRWESYPREFSKCRRCKRTKYCSRDCQMRAWHCHRNWCIPSNSSNTTNTTEPTAAATPRDGPSDETDA